MSFLLQKDVPLVLTIIVAAWTWILSEQVKSFDRLQLVEYQYAAGGNNNKLLFRNASQSQSIKSLKIVVTCRKGPDCFDLKGGFAGTTEIVPPFGVKPDEIGSEGTSYGTFTFSLAIGSAIVLSMYLKDPSGELRFMVVNAQAFDRLKLVERNAWFARLYRYQWALVYVLLFVATVSVFWLMKTQSPPSPAPKQSQSRLARLATLRFARKKLDPTSRRWK
jgi:hypothetical protein